MTKSDDFPDRGLRRAARIGAGKAAPGADTGVGVGKLLGARHVIFDDLLVLAGEQPVMGPAAPDVIMQPIVEAAQRPETAPIVDVEAAGGVLVDRRRPLYERVIAALAADHHQSW